MKTVCLVICVFLFFSAAGHVESRRHRDDRQQSYKLFVFGDTFVDNGNSDKSELAWDTRGWYRPYGISFANRSSVAGRVPAVRPTGRFSDGKVQSDFVAMILGHDESPAPENTEDGDETFGMNFAVGSAGVRGSQAPSSFAMQINLFRKLLKHEVIEKDISQSVALVGFSGYDYAYIPDAETDHDGFVNFIDGVTDAIADGVSDILDLGVTKVLVNTLQPMGCSPRYTRPTNYSECTRDQVTEIHNKKVKEKLGSEDSVLLLDLYTVFNKIIHPRSTRFLHRHIPCCESDEVPYGFCGEVDEYGARKYEVCDNPDKYFYFDEWHPTQAGWSAVMEQLEDPIREFLGISS